MNKAMINAKGMQPRADGVAPVILVPVDFTACSREALHTAIRYAQRFGARIILLHVIDIAVDFLETGRADVQRIETEIRQQAATEFEWAKSTYRESGVPFENMVVEGLPGEEIVAVAGKRNALLIVIGQHPNSKPWSLFHRHTVNEVLSKAHCEVVVMHKTNGKRPPDHHKKEFVSI